MQQQAQQQELKPRPLEEAAAATAELNSPAAPHDGSQASRVDAKPLLRRVSSVAAGIRRRRSVAAGDLFAAGAAAPPFTQSLRDDLSVVAAAETFVITQVAVTILSYIGSLSTFGFGFFALLSMVGYRWISKILALGCYAMILMPGFLQVGYYYYFSSQVWRNIIYGEQPRNSFDLYLPKNFNGLRPVLIFVTGGAWIIGNKAWGSLLGKRLAERGVLVACIDYRNFPQGTISDMVKDTSEGISFVVNNAVEFGGDPNRIYLMGQSAGAHIATCALVHQAIKECSEGETITWSVSQIRAAFGSSGGYNLGSLVDHFHKRGMYKSVFLSIMEGEESFPRYSPEIVVQDPSVRDAVSRLPPVVLFHGTADYSIPSVASKNFAEALRSIGIQVRLVLYEGKTHTDLFLQDPLRGGRDELLEEVMKVIRAGDAEALNEDALKVPARRLVPEWMLQLAREVSPF